MIYLVRPSPLETHVRLRNLPACWQHAPCDPVPMTVRRIGATGRRCKKTQAFKAAKGNP